MFREAGGVDVDPVCVSNEQKVPIARQCCLVVKVSYEYEKVELLSLAYQVVAELGDYWSLKSLFASKNQSWLKRRMLSLKGQKGV